MITAIKRFGPILLNKSALIPGTILKAGVINGDEINVWSRYWVPNEHGYFKPLNTALSEVFLIRSNTEYNENSFGYIDTVLIDNTAFHVMRRNSETRYVSYEELTEYLDKTHYVN